MNTELADMHAANGAALYNSGVARGFTPRLHEQRDSMRHTFSPKLCRYLPITAAVIVITEIFQSFVQQGISLSSPIICLFDHRPIMP
ncbi:hypothetical protein NPIL_508961 [Nephila pilipes]|uniref:Uncharacterized protein n=1 Tax=Nephila pilipes TaxID=299642 RepID=A0A8X6IHE9_NEPPI|nr:hypothetical protein NPIL_508961 [Nephila pilipes]